MMYMCMMHGSRLAQSYHFLIMASAQEKHREMLSSSRTTRAVHKLEQRHKRWFKEVVKHERPAPHLNHPRAAEFSSLVMLSMVVFFCTCFPSAPLTTKSFLVLNMLVLICWYSNLGIFRCWYSCMDALMLLLNCWYSNVGINSCIGIQLLKLR